MVIDNLRGFQLVAALSVSLSVPAGAGTAIPPSENGGDTAAPRLELPKPVHDFGRLRPLESVNCSIPLRNVGNVSLTISNLRSSCGCTVAELEKQELRPGEGTELHVTFTAGSTPGKTRKTVTFRTNDPEAATATIEICGEVIARLIAEPKALRFGNVPLGEGRTIELDIRRGEHEPEWDSLRVVSNTMPVTVEPMRRSEDAPDRWPYRVTLNKDVPRGRIFGYIEVFVNDETRPAARLTVSGIVLGRINVTPRVVSVYTRTGAAPATGRVVLSHQTDQPFNIVGLRCDVPYIVWELDAMQGRARYEIRLRLKDDAPLGRLLRGDIVVTTNEPREREIRIPVMAQRLAPSMPVPPAAYTRGVMTNTQTERPMKPSQTRH